MDKNDLISRSATLHAMKMDPAPPFRVVMEMPAIDPKELRPTGRWEYTSSACDPFCAVYRCSYCGAEDENGFYYNYCPNCGAKMMED